MSSKRELRCCLNLPSGFFNSTSKTIHKRRGSLDEKPLSLMTIPAGFMVSEEDKPAIGGLVTRFEQIVVCEPQHESNSNVDTCRDDDGSRAHQDCNGALGLSEHEIRDVPGFDAFLMEDEFWFYLSA